MKQKLELPKTLRAPRADEVPNNPSSSERLEASKTANIVEGYIITPKDSSPEHADIPFNFYAEININNSRLWDLMVALSNELPDTVSVIFNQSDSEPTHGEYADKEQVLEFLSQYRNEIVSDTFIELGLIFHSETEFIEVFISDFKNIKFWGVNEESFCKTMKSFGLDEVQDIEFVHEYPTVREAFKLFDSDSVDPVDLIEKLKEKFE